MIAITRLPSPRMAEALRTYVAFEPIDLPRVRAEHAAYCAALARAGAEVVTLATDLDAPDAVFVEDTAVVLDELAILAAPGAPSRAAEVPAVERELVRHRARIARITAPATLDGGDVLRVGRALHVGVSGRTSRAGVEQLAALTAPYGYTVEAVPVRGCLHLKTACTALPDGTFLTNPAWVDRPAALHVHPDEPAAANVVVLGERVLMAAAFPRTRERIERRGFTVEAVDLSELAKAEGAATCLSLLFRREPPR